MTATEWLVVTLLVSSAALSQAEECPSYDTLEKVVYLPHPYDCSLFRRCQAGQPVLGHCPPGQHFNPSAKVCDDPARAGCTAMPNTCSSKKPQSTCRYQCRCSKDKQRGSCPSTLKFIAELNVVDLALYPGCEEEPSDFMLGANKLGTLVVRNATATVSMCDQKTGVEHVPHFADCSKGVLCEDGKEKILKCPGGYMYDASLGYCDEPQYVNCTTSASPPASNDCPHDAAASECHHTCSCEVYEGSCPARLGFTTTTSIFDAVKQPACLKGQAVIMLGDQFAATLAIHPNTTVSRCPTGQHAAPLYLRHPSSCGAAVLCHRGKERIVYCPIDQVFDLKLRKCVKSNPAICKIDTPSTSVTPTPPVASEDLPCSPATTCPAGSSGNVAHLTDCSLFCRCAQGTTTLGACPPGLHFNAQAQACDLPNRSNCKTFCKRLAPAVGGTWSQQGCINGDSAEGTQCSLTCDSKHQLVGSALVVCSKKGWSGTGGLNIIPSCNTTEQVAVIIVNKINDTLSQLDQNNESASLLFILDESGSVGSNNFQIEKDFAAALVKAFPLSRSRSAGVITFSDSATVDIDLTETNTCNFLSRLKGIVYSGGGTDLATALNVALDEVNRHSSGKMTLAFAVTDGLSQTDPTAAAQAFRTKDRQLFTIGVASYDRNQLEPISSTYKDGSKLFFGLPSFAVFNVVAEYLRTTYNHGAAYNCP